MNFKISALGNSAKFKGKHPCRSHFFNKKRKRDPNVGFYHRTTPTAASVYRQKINSTKLNLSF